MSISVRQKKVSEQVKRLVVKQLMFELLADNPIKNMFSVSKTQISSDLKSVNMYITVNSSDKRVKKLIVETLNTFQNEIRFMLGKEMVSKTVPKIRFLLDISENDLKIDLSSIKSISAEDIL